MSLCNPRAVPWLLVCGAGCLGLTACVSVDAEGDIAQAEALVAERSGVVPAWRWQATDPGAEFPEAESPQVMPQESGSPGGPSSGARDWSWPPPGPVEVAYLVRRALVSHPGMRAGLESIAQSRADLAQACLLPNPVIQATFGFPLDSAPGNPAMGSWMQPLAALWQRPAKRDAAEARLRATVLSVADTALNLVADVRVAAAEYGAAEVASDSAAELVGIRQEIAELVLQKIAVGEAGALDRNGAQLRLAEAQMAATEAARDQERAARRLLELCGVAEGGASFEVVAPGPESGLAAAELLEREVMALASQQRLDLAAAQALMESELEGVHLAELRRLRALSAGLGYQRNFQDLEALGPTLALELPIFDDGRAERAKAGSKARAARLEVLALRQGVLRMAREAWCDLKADAGHYRHSSELLLPLAVENESLHRQAFEAGVTDRLAWLAAQARLVEARAAQQRWCFAVVRAHARLDRAVGGRAAPPDPLASQVSDSSQTGVWSSQRALPQEGV